MITHNMYRSTKKTNNKAVSPVAAPSKTTVLANKSVVAVAATVTFGHQERSICTRAVTRTNISLVYVFFLVYVGVVVCDSKAPSMMSVIDTTEVS